MRKKTKKTLDWIAIYLLLLGGIEILFLIFNFNLIGLLGNFLEKVIFIFIGGATIWLGGRTKPFTPFGRMFID